MLREHLAFAFLSVLIFLTSSCLVEGACPSISPLVQFDQQKFTGTWYLAAVSSRSANVCQSIDITSVGDYKFHAANGIDGSKTSGSENIDMTGNGKFKLTGSDGQANDFGILDIQYDSYFVLDGCQSNSEIVYIYTRDAKPTASFINNLIRSNYVTKPFKSVTVKGC